MKRVIHTLVGLLLTSAGLSAQQPDSAKPLGNVVRYATATAQTKSDSASGEVLLGARKVRLLGVYDIKSGDPIVGAEVTDILMDSTVKTTSTGTVSLHFVMTWRDTAAIRIAKLGFVPETLHLAMSEDAPITLTLNHIPESLPGMKVVAIRRSSATMQAFEDRRTSGRYSGEHFVAPEELRKDWSGQDMRFVLAKHGMTARSRGPSSMQNRSCVPLYFVDKVPIDAARGKQIEFESADKYDGVEYYPSMNDAPGEFARGVTKAPVCSIFVFYSRGS